MPCLVRDSGVYKTMSFIGDLVSHKTRIVECGVVRMGGLVYATITIYLRFMSK